jgi:hypothetical protein
MPILELFRPKLFISNIYEIPILPKAIVQISSLESAPTRRPASVDSKRVTVVPKSFRINIYKKAGGGG